MTLGKRTGSMLVAYCALVAPAASAQTTSRTVSEIVARNLEAKGGPALAAVQSVRQVLSVDVLNTRIELVVYSQRPNFVRQEMVVAGKAIVEAFDGTVAWTRNGLTGSGEVTELTGARAEVLRTQAAFDGVLAGAAAHGRQIELLGTAIVDGREAHHLRLVDEHQVRHCYLDAQTGLEMRIVQETSNGRLQQDLSDYRDVNGVRVPHTIRTSIDGRLATVVTVTEVALNVPLDSGLFARPH